MYDGSIAATTFCTLRGTANVTRPAPLRSADWPASEMAPLIPREPPMSSARPKSPLWLSGRRGGRSGKGVSVRSSSFMRIKGFSGWSSAWPPTLIGLMQPGGDQAGQETGFEAGVDVDDRDVVRTTVEHRQQRRNAAEVGAVADARRHGNDGARHVSANDARQRAFHAGHDDNCIGVFEIGESSRKTVRTGDTDIVDHGHRDAHPIERFAGFLGDRQVAGAGEITATIPLPFGEGLGEGSSAIRNVRAS